jgi:hypothetical protein
MAVPLAFTSSELLLASSNPAKLEFWAAVGACAGVYLFFRGFRMLRFKRLILNTPFSKVRSASMGLVEIGGMAKGPHTIPAAITGEPCYLYTARVWKLRQNGKDREWDLVADESMFVPFFVEDSTGRMLVDPRGAQLDVHRSFHDEIGISYFSSRDLMPPNISKFLLQHGLSSLEGIRLEEYSIQPDYPLFILGTLGRNSLDRKWTPSPYLPLLPSSSQSPWLQVLNGTFGITIQSSSAKVAARTPGIAPTAAPSMSVTEPARTPAPAASNWSSISMDEANWRSSARVAAPAKNSAAAGASLQAPPGDAPSRKSQVAVADPPVPSAAAHPEKPGDDEWDLTTPVAISKGADGAPFTISAHSQREVVQSLAWKSTLFIWGGPILTITCLYFLASAFGWM